MFRIQLAIENNGHIIEKIPLGVLPTSDSYHHIVISMLLKQFSNREFADNEFLTLYLDSLNSGSRKKDFALYNKTTGKFSDWHSSSGLVTDDLRDLLSEINAQVVGIADISLNNLKDHLLITKYGDKTIFSLDSQFAYTVCGRSMPIEKALFRKKLF